MKGMTMIQAKKRTSESKKETGLTPAAGYIRMSGRQQDASPERQRSEIIVLARREHCRIVEWYEDHALTGTESLNRPRFQSLLQDAKKGKFKTVLLYEQSRMSREDVFKTMAHWEKFRDAGVGLITCQRGRIDFSNLGGIITAIVDQHSSHDEVIKIAERGTSGKRKKLASGHIAGGCPFGYDREIRDENGTVVRVVDHRDRFIKPNGWSSRLVITSDEVALKSLRYAFTEVANGRTPSSVAVELHGQGLTGRHGAKFSPGQLKRILVNPVYIGTLRYGQKPSGKFARVTDSVISIENAHPAIIDVQTFNRVQQALQARYKRHKPKQPGKYLLTGLLRCGHCGGRMDGHPNRKVASIYTCHNGPSALKPCDNPPYVCGFNIEANVLRIVDLELRQPNLGKIAKAAASGQAVRIEETLAPSLAAVQAKIKKASVNLALADDKTQFLAISGLIADWKAEERDIIAKIERAESADKNRFAAQATIAELRQTDLSSLDRVKLAMALQQTIESITLKKHYEGRNGVFLRVVTGSLVFRPEIYQGPPIEFVANWGVRNCTWLAILSIIGSAERPLTTPEVSALIEMDRGPTRNQITKLALAGMVQNVGGDGEFMFTTTKKGQEVLARLIR
jgi:DNA invertase Pin-like site-specific DNA recombinase